jgi:aspartate racemase
MDQVDEQTFGLVMGLGMGGGIFYYRSLVEEHRARGLSAHLLMVHADVRRVLGLVAARERRELALYLAGLLQRLADGGAKLATIPAFAPQICAEELAVLSPLPLVGLVDVIADEVERRKLRRVALFGGRATVESRMFGRLEDRAEVISPRKDEIDLVNEMYVRIVEKEHATQEEYEALRQLAHELVERERLDAIVLAGTDLSFVFRPENTDFPHLDGARVHVEAIMRRIAPVNL